MFHLRVLLLPLPLLIAGCGVVAAFLPPIEIGDPLAVEGQTLTTTFDGDGGSSLSTLVYSEAQSTVTHSFDDIELDLRGFSVQEFHASIGIDPVVDLSAPDALSAFPDSFAIVQVAATAAVSDDVHGEAILSMEKTVWARFELDPGSCSLSTCSYRYVEGDPLEDLLSISVTDPNVLQKFIEVVRLEGESSVNRGSFSLGVVVDSDPSLSGFSATFTLRSGGTSIKLGG